MKFVLFLAAKGREGLLLEVIGQFDRLRDRKQGVIHATVKSVVPFTKAQEELLVRQLESATGKKLRLTYVIDASLKGGFTVQQEDTVWDASVRHQLERLHIQFMES
jgi:F-type H+-transporting ATPase subunit delta